MLKFKIKIALTLIFLLFVFSSTSFARYNVNGLVEYSFRDYETKVGDARTSESILSQLYQAGMTTDIWDPRFLNVTAGVSYNIQTSSKSPDSRVFGYTLKTSFFPSMKISWDLFGNRTSTTVQSSAYLPGYDVTTTQYGGTLYLRLGSKRGNGNKNNNRNNNNNNNNYYRSSRPIILPDIILQRTHYEAEAESAAVPILETRDDTHALITYHYNSRLDVTMDGMLQKYENNAVNSSYDTKAANVTANYQESPDARLTVRALLNDRSTRNITGFDSKTTTNDYLATYNVRERDGIAQNYTYEFNVQKGTGYKQTGHLARGGVTYRLLKGLHLRGGLSYENISHTTEATATAPAQENAYQSGGLDAGLAYAKLFRPEFLGAFGLNTTYDFTMGYSKVSIANSPDSSGGIFYGNSASLMLQSVDWKTENVLLGYHISAKRDHSDLANDSRSQGFSATLVTKRIPRTVINAAANYTTLESSSRNPGAALFLPMAGDTTTQGRNLTYHADLVHTLTDYLKFSTGLSQGHDNRQTTYTLSTLPVSNIDTTTRLAYAALNYDMGFTRNLFYHAEVREEDLKRKDQTGNIDTWSHILNMFLDYRFRAIFARLEYRWRQDIPDVGARAEQSYIYAKISRPF